MKPTFLSFFCAILLTGMGLPLFATSVSEAVKTEVQVSHPAVPESPDLAQAEAEISQASPAKKEKIVSPHTIVPTSREAYAHSSKKLKKQKKARGFFSLNPFQKKGRSKPTKGRPNLGGGTSLVFGIVGLAMLMEFAVYALICGLFAVGFAIVGLNNDPNPTMAVIGLILGAICLISYLLIATGAIVF